MSDKNAPQPSPSSTSPTAIERRTFLAGALTSAAAVALAARPGPRRRHGPRRPRRRPGQGVRAERRVMAAETQTPPAAPALTTQKTSSDFMVDVIKTLKIDYLTCLPGSTFRALHELIINNPPNPNRTPEFITCLHEDTAVAIAHGYAKTAGKPMAAMVHGTVGLQHAAMAIYNAYADRVPMVILSGNANDAMDRRPGVEWEHSVQDGGALVRDFVKWDDNPGSLQAWAESTVRAYQLTNAVPTAPVLLIADTKLQEEPLEAHEEARLRIPKYRPQVAPQADAGACASWPGCWSPRRTR